MNKLKATIIVPVALAAILVPFSLFIGWSVFTLIIFWMVLVPVLSIILPAKLSRNRNNFYQSIFGLLIFYGLMILMIYDHYKTDYFQIMIWSLNLF